jgi:hypothetical protein
MVEVREMPYVEKYNEILGMMKVLEGFAPQLVKDELGDDKLDELRNIWKQEADQVTKDASDKEKYEVAYRNFMNNWVSTSNFMVKHQKDVGSTKFMRAAIAGWNRKYVSQALILRTMRNISSKTAFKTLAKRLAYQLQAFSPFSVKELTDKKMILTVTPCKILETREGNNFCSKACQNIIPSWLEKQFNIKMVFNRQGENCLVTFEPF